MTVKWHGHKLTADLRKAIVRGVAIVAYRVEETAVTSITEGSKTGRTYTRRGVVHQASAPGEPPAADLGGLHTSISVKLDFGGLRAFINAGASYAAALEYGTARMEPRPFMRPALARNIGNLQTTIAKEVKNLVGS